MNPMMQGGGPPMAAPPMMQGGMMGGGMPMGGPPQPQGASPYPPVPQVDLLSLLKQFPGLTPELLLQLIGQTADPMEEAMESRGAMQGQPNPLLAALMQTGAAPPQAMQPAPGY